MQSGDNAICDNFHVGERVDTTKRINSAIFPILQNTVVKGWRVIQVQLKSEVGSAEGTAVKADEKASSQYVSRHSR